MTKYPLIIEMTKREAIKKIADLAKAYTPEWRFREETPDIGSVIALIYADLLKESTDEVNKSLLRHHIHLLNCLEVEAKVAKPAQCYVTFEVVPTLNTGVMVKKGTSLIGRNESGEEIPFVTCHSMYASNVKPTSMFITSKQKDYIGKVYKEKSPLNQLNLALFDMQEENIQCHGFYFKHEFILDGMTEGECSVQIESDNQAVIHELLQANWCIRTDNKWEEVPVTISNQKLVLKLKEGLIHKQIFNHEEGYWFGVFIRGEIPDISFKKLSLSVAHANCKADTICTQDKVCLENTVVYPFGTDLQLYGECYIRCDEAFAKKGADVTLSFVLAYDVNENKGYEVVTKPIYKLIMRKQAPKQEIIPIDIRADEVVWEYLSEKGWVRLPVNAACENLFNGQLEGIQKINFRCPEDMAVGEVNAYEGRWIRLRLIRADHIYTVPSKTYVPKISEIQLHYSYENALAPKEIFIENNAVCQSVALNENKVLTAFDPLPFEGSSLFIGFDELPKASPMCLFFEIENKALYSLPSLRFEYSTLKNEQINFEILKVSDGTCHLSQSGNVMLMIPSDFRKTKIFNEEKYWLRISEPDGKYEETPWLMPIIKGIYPNTVRVVNETQKKVYFYITETVGQKNVVLQDENIVSVEVYINEKPTSQEGIEEVIENARYSTQVEKDANGNLEELWVKWEQVERESDLESRRRCYYFNQITHEIIFPENIFIHIPVKLNYESIRVTYYLCEGTKANVERGTIDTLGQTVSFINRIYNPIEAFGSSDFESIEQALQRMAKYLLHRDKMVTTRDYEMVVSGYCSDIARVKCLPQINDWGNEETDAMTLAILLKDYDKGGHVFLGYKEDLERYILAHSDLKIRGMKLYLREPLFIKLSVRIWVTTEDMEKAYEYQSTIKEAITRFIDPITGYFDGKGWDIGVLPQKRQLDAYLKALRLECVIHKIILTTAILKDNKWVQRELVDLKDVCFGIAISGEHEILVNLVGDEIKES